MLAINFKLLFFLVLLLILSFFPSCYRGILSTVYLLMTPTWKIVNRVCVKGWSVWGFLKPRIHAGKPRTLGELKTAIHENIQELGEETLVKVEANFRNRLQIFAHKNGHHVSDEIFHSQVFHDGIVYWVFLCTLMNFFLNICGVLSSLKTSVSRDSPCICCFDILQV